MNHGTMEPRHDNVKTVKKSKEEKKLLRKQIKASHTLLKHDGVCTVSHPTKSLVVANGGLGNGVSREQLCAALKEMGEIETLVMPPHKPYAFVTYRSEESAQKAFALLNSQQLQCGENIVTLYLSFVDTVAGEQEVPASLPEGLALLGDFVSAEEEIMLLKAFDWSSASEGVTVRKALKHRRVKHYGYEFRYDINNVDKDKPLSAGLPEECIPILKRCVKNGHVDAMPDQLTVNQYQPGQGIPPHVDTHSAFEDTLLSLSLGSKAVMEFRHPDGRVASVVLPGRSLLVMKGESRFLWTHGITPRKFDMVPASDPQPPAPVTSDLGKRSDLTLSKRGTRTSFTFRKIRRAPCRCAFPSACDSQGAPSPPSLPRCHDDAARLEEAYVHRVYEAIAPHFSGTRHSPWPRVSRFLRGLPAGSVLADVGCGNGKYLGVNDQLAAVGCDRSTALVQICAERGHQALVSDALRVPLRSASCDACISIAVIHHLSTQERRLAAVAELARLLKRGGRALIYVWALEQEHEQQRSKYLRDGNREPLGEVGEEEHTSEADGESNIHGDPNAGAATDHTADSVPPGKLSVHTNRTAFNSQDLLVPWHLKQGRGKVQGGTGAKGKKGEMKAGSQITSEKPSMDGPSPDTNPGAGPGVGSTGPGCMPNPRPGARAAPASGPSSDSEPAGSVFHRYYHVFQQGELEQICSRVAGVRVQSSYHDQGNWCVVLVKE